MSYSAYLRANEMRMRVAGKLSVRQILKIAAVFSVIVSFFKENFSTVVQLPLVHYFIVFYFSFFWVIYLIKKHWVILRLA